MQTAIVAFFDHLPQNINDDNRKGNRKKKNKATIPFVVHDLAREDRQSSAKQAWREKSRKRDDRGAESSFESREYRAAVRIDLLEEVFDNSATGVNGDGAGDEEYDEEKDFRGASKKNKSSKSKRKRCGSASSVTARNCYCERYFLSDELKHAAC